MHSVRATRTECSSAADTRTWIRMASFHVGSTAYAPPEFKNLTQLKTNQDHALMDLLSVARFLYLRQECNSRNRTEEQCRMEFDKVLIHSMGDVKKYAR